MLKKTAAITLLLFFLTTQSATAGPQSSTYELKEFGFGSGGTTSNDSSTYSLFGVLGEQDLGKMDSTTYQAQGGLTYTLIANTPPAPTLANPDNSYNKLNLTLNTAGNSLDTKFAIAISPDNFSSTTNYIQNDNTVGTTLGSEDWQTSTVWGASGFNVVGLNPTTTYSVKVKAKQGDYTETPWGPISQANTTGASLTFSLTTDAQGSPPFSIALGNLTPGSITTAANKAHVSVTTNAVSGVNIYVQGQNGGLRSTNDNYTISAVSNNLTSVTEGYGARGTSVSQSSGGPMAISSPYNGAATNVGIVDTTKRNIFNSTDTKVTGGTGSFELKAKVSSVTPAGTDYADTLTILAIPNF